MSRPHLHRLAMLAALLVGACSGCTFFTEGDYPDVPGASPERLHSIPTLDTKAMAKDEPSSSPADPAGPAPEPPREVSLTLEECRADALRNNLGLQVSLLDPSIARESLAEQEARFERSIFASTSYSRTEGLLTPPTGSTTTKSLSASAGVDFPLRTGGSLQFAAPASRMTTSGAGGRTQGVTGGATATLYQPLLRDGGVDVSAHSIRIARYEWQAVGARTRLEVTRVIAAVDRVYWRLYAARRELEVRKNEHDLALAQLDRARRMVDAGATAEVEIIRAESGVAERLEGIIIADNAVRDRERELKRVLNRPDLTVQSPTVIVPASPPDAVRYDLDLRKLTGAAMENRMEMLELEIQLAEQASNISFAKNQKLPFLAVDYTYGINGLGGTASDAYDLLFDRPVQSHSVGLELSVPLGNRAAEAALRRSLLSKAQTLSSRDRQVLVIEQEVAAALDQLESNWHRVLASGRAAELAQRTLDAENRQFGLGLRTSTDVLDAQTKLANARSAEIIAVTEYQIAKIDLAFATGMLLGEAAVQWVPIDLAGQ